MCDFLPASYQKPNWWKVSIFPFPHPLLYPHVRHTSQPSHSESQDEGRWGLLACLSYFLSWGFTRIIFKRTHLKHLAVNRRVFLTPLFLIASSRFIDPAMLLCPTDSLGFAFKSIPHLFIHRNFQVRLTILANLSTSARLAGEATWWRVRLKQS